MKYYVYLHISGDEPAYVGKGSGGRLLDTQGRSKEHKDFMVYKFNCGEYNFATMVRKDLTEDEAFLLEHRLIKFLNPTFNIRGKELPTNYPSRPTIIKKLDRLLSDLYNFDEGKARLIPRKRYYSKPNV